MSPGSTDIDRHTTKMKESRPTDRIPSSRQKSDTDTLSMSDRSCDRSTVSLRRNHESPFHPSPHPAGVACHPTFAFA